MAATYDLNDDGVVVVIGSGAGGGTLANELAQKGIDVVCLEAGPRVEIDEFVNDEWSNFVKISWLDKRTTSGSWRVARDFPGLPAWIVKAVGGSTIHWAGASLRFQEHEFKAKTTYGDIEMDLPPDASARIVARTGDGDLDSEVEGLDLQAGSDGSERKWEGTLGSGSHSVTLATSHGDIRLRARRP